MASAANIGLALGGGGARGLPHIHVLRAFDDLGIKPARIAGTSIGAMLGACYAAGYTAREIEEHVLHETRSARDLIARAMSCRSGKISQIFTGDFGSVMMDGEKLISTFLPPLPETFEELEIPLILMGADYYGRKGHEMASGPLKSAVAASIALPTVIVPVRRDGLVLIDGGYINPLPFDLLGENHPVIAVDVTGGPRQPKPDEALETPKMMDAVFNAIFLMAHSITMEKLKTRQPDLLIRPAIEEYQVLEFYKAREILEATRPVYDEVKSYLQTLI